MLTVGADRPRISANNELIRSLPATHPNVVVLDWDGLSQGPDLVGHLSSDGIHLRDDVAKTYFTNVVLQALGLPTERRFPGDCSPWNQHFDNLTTGELERANRRLNNKNNALDSTSRADRPEGARTKGPLWLGPGKR